MLTIRTAKFNATYFPLYSIQVRDLSDAVSDYELNIYIYILH